MMRMLSYQEHIDSSYFNNIDLNTNNNNTNNEIGRN